MSLEQLVQLHREIITGHRELLALVGTSESMPVLAKLRQSIASRILHYHALSHEHVFEPLRASGDPAHVELAKQLTAAELRARGRALDYYQRWTMHAVLADPDGYRQALRARLEATERYFTKMETLAHPAVRAAAAAHAAHRAA